MDEVKVGVSASSAAKTAAKYAALRLVFQAHRRVYLSSLGSRAIKKKSEVQEVVICGFEV